MEVQETVVAANDTLSYHDCDFQFDSIVQESEKLLNLIQISPYSSVISLSKEFVNSTHLSNIDSQKDADDSTNLTINHESMIQLHQEHMWNLFFNTHEQGRFFQPKSYIFKEFQFYFQASHIKTILEVGCGHGSTLFPLLIHLSSSIEYIATDYSQSALSILTNSTQWIPLEAHFDPTTASTTTSATTNSDINLIDIPIGTASALRQRVHMEVWDVTKPIEKTKYLNSIDIVLCIFSLSAIHPIYHPICMSNINSITRQGGYVLIRDYGVFDMTMFRHKYRYDTYLFQRSDGTLCYYFSIEYIKELAIQANFQVIELKYACVKNVNRKSGKEMKRVFIHVVLQKL